MNGFPLLMLSVACRYVTDAMLLLVVLLDMIR
jgi:hypothetical protein